MGDDAQGRAPNVARMYDYYLGGVHNTRVDRDAAVRMQAVVPEISDVAWANRGFLQRAVRYIAERGVRQFLDIGAGLPTQNNTHEAARMVDESCRVVYVDKDPDAVDVSRTLIDGISGVEYLPGDLADPAGLLETGLDLSEPVGLLVVGIAYLLSDDEDPWGKVRTLLDGLPSGSYLALSHLTADLQPREKVEGGLQVYSDANVGVYLRPRAEVARFFEGLELVSPYDGAAPDLAYSGVWGAADPVAADDEAGRWLYVGVGRKP